MLELFGVEALDEINFSIERFSASNISCYMFLYLSFSVNKTGAQR